VKLEEDERADKGVVMDSAIGASTAAVTNGNAVGGAIGGAVGGALSPNRPIAGAL